MNRLVAFVPILSMIMGLALGWAIAMSAESRYVERPKDVSTPRPDEAIVRMEMKPARITVVVEDLTSFCAHALPNKCWNTYAFTITDREPCEVHLREGIRLFGDPDTGMAAFENSEDAIALAHELMHCYRPRWHDR